MMRTLELVNRAKPSLLYTVNTYLWWLCRHRSRICGENGLSKCRGTGKNGKPLLMNCIHYYKSEANLFSLHRLMRKALQMLGLNQVTKCAEVNEEGWLRLTIPMPEDGESKSRILRDFMELIAEWIVNMFTAHYRVLPYRLEFIMIAIAIDYAEFSECPGFSHDIWGRLTVILRPGFKCWLCSLARCVGAYALHGSKDMV